MATAVASRPLAIPGLDQQPTPNDMRMSGNIYNTLPDDSEQPEVPQEVIAELRYLIRKFGVQNRFGFHLVHGHVKMAEGKVMFGKPMQSLPGMWARPTSFDQLDLQSLHGYVFALIGDNDSFHPYEFRQGPPAQLTAQDRAFVAAAREYIQGRGLAGVVDLEFLQQATLGKYMKEFVLSESDGTVMLPAKAVNMTEDYRTTGWNAVEGVTERKGNVAGHAGTTKGTHQVWFDGKGLPDVDGDF